MNCGYDFENNHKNDGVPITYLAKGGHILKTQKIIALAAAGIMAVALTGCGSAPEKGGSASGDGGKKIKACLVSDNGGFQDQSFNQSAHEGMEKAKKELGIEVKYAQSKVESDFNKNVESMVQQKCDLIIGVGFLLNNAIRDAAKKNPKINFALIDAIPSEDDFKPSNLKNAKPILFDTAQAAYLAGYVAASQTKTGKLGTYVGMSLPSTDIFVDGFSLGVEQYNKDNGKSVTLLGKDQTVGDFSNTTKGKQITENLFSQGADIVMPVAGPVGLGTLSAAKAAQKNVIWVDSDGYKSTKDGSIIITSVMKKIGEAVFDTVKETQEGKYTSKPYIGTLANKGVDIAPFHDFDSKIDAKVKTKLEEIRKGIVDGKIKYETKKWF